MERGRILSDYRQSGLTQKAFAAKAGIGGLDFESMACDKPPPIIIRLSLSLCLICCPARRPVPVTGFNGPTDASWT